MAGLKTKALLMRLQELFETAQKQKLDEETRDQWDIKVNEHSDYTGILGTISISTEAKRFFERYMEAVEQLKQKGLPEDQYKKAHEELRNALDHARDEVENMSVEDEVKKVSETMYAMMKSILAEASEQKAQVFEKHINEVLKRHDS